MSKLELKKLKAELAAVHAGRLNVEYQIEVGLDNIQRLETAMEQQKAKETELSTKIKEMEQLPS